MTTKHTLSLKERKRQERLALHVVNPCCRDCGALLTLDHNDPAYANLFNHAIYCRSCVNGIRSPARRAA